MPDKPVLAAVSYINTKPFLYGLAEHNCSEYVDIELLNPGNLADALLNGYAHIGLVPVAAIPTLKGYTQFGNYGIGSLGDVASVCAFSHKPMHDCQYVLLDYQSRTSIALMQVLMKTYWKLDIPVMPAKPGYETNVPEEALAVIIGDRALEARQHFGYVYDLAQAWKELTGLPFVFAAWVAHESVPASILAKLNEAFAYGVTHIQQAIQHFNIHLPYYNINTYLNKNIYYPIGEEQKQAQALFLSYCSQWLPTV